MKTLMTTRWRPTNYTHEITVPEFGVECFYQTEPNPIIVGYYGKSAKAAFHYRYRTVEEMLARTQERIDNYVKNRMGDIERKSKQKQLTSEMKASDHYAIGDIIVNSWGYEQTNVDYYQVIEVLPKSLKVREIGCTMTDATGPMACHVVPEKDSFTDKDPFLLRLKTDSKGVVWICNPESYYYFHKWDGRPNYMSWYA